MCLDHPEAVRKVRVMDIVPTLTMYRETKQKFATKYMWWFFLIQKEPLPEHMIGADSLFFLNMHFEIQNGTPCALTDDALAEYRRCFCPPEAIHASCEDYRAAADIDLEMDEADKRAEETEREAALTVEEAICGSFVPNLFPSGNKTDNAAVN